MVIERWNSNVKGAMWWDILLWNYFLKIVKFWRHYLKIRSKDSNLRLMTSQQGSKGGEASGYRNFQKLTWKMNCSPQILYGYWFWSFYHCWYILVQTQVLFDPMTSWRHKWRQGIKNFKISLINILLILMFLYLRLLIFFHQ